MLILCPENTLMTDKALLTVREYAAEARVTERTVRRWITEGRLRALRQGKNTSFQARNRRVHK